MKNSARNMTAKEKVCYIAFDEMSVKQHLQYSQRMDMIIGFQENGEERNRTFASEALVLMARGVHKLWYQPFTFYLTEKGMSSAEIVVHLKSAIKHLRDAGFQVVATVCDQGTRNKPAYNALRDETRQKYIRRNEECRTFGFEIDDEEIIPLFDPPHLLKCWRNNLMEKDILFTINDERKKASWKHIRKAYDSGLLPGDITEFYIDSTKVNKMRVKYAAAIFSNRCAQALRDGVEESKCYKNHS